MSIRRDPIWIKSTTTLQATSLIQNTLAVLAIPCSSTYITQGDIPPDGHKELHGKIEHVTLFQNNTTLRNIDVLFLGSTGLGGYIDHESFATADFINVVGATGTQRAAHSGLAIPYLNKLRNKIFYVGLVNRTAATLAPKLMTVEFSWRADYGEP